MTRPLMRDIGIRPPPARLAVTGIDWVFAPTLAIVQDMCAGGEPMRAIPPIPEIVSPACQKRYCSGLQGHPALDNFLTEEEVVATAKHFVGDGGPVYEHRPQ